MIVLVGCERSGVVSSALHKCSVFIDRMINFDS